MLGGFCVRVTTGTTVSIVHWNEATALALPAASSARTKNVCRPSANGPNEAPLAHAANAAASTRHWKPDAPAELNVKVVDAVRTRAACGAIVGTAGATVSIVQVYELTALSLPAASTAFARRVCSPSASGPANDVGLEQGGKPDPSRRQPNVTPASESLKMNVALVELVGFGGP